MTSTHIAITHNTHTTRSQSSSVQTNSSMQVDAHNTVMEMKKLAIFHICALPQLYVEVGPPPGKIFWIRALHILVIIYLACMDRALRNMSPCNIY